MVGVCCSVPGCYSRETSKHRFPNPIKDRERFEKWQLLLCGNKELLKKSPEKTYANCRVCSEHFLPRDFGTNNRLLKTAIPSLKLAGEDLEDILFKLKSKREVSIHEIKTGSNRGSDPNPQGVLYTYTGSTLKTEEPDPINEAVDSPTDIRQFSPVYLDDSPRGTLKTEEPDAIDEGVASPNSDLQQSIPADLDDSSTTSENELYVTIEPQLRSKARRVYPMAIHTKKRCTLTSRSRLAYAKENSEENALSNTFTKPLSTMDRIRKRFFERRGRVENVREGRRYTLEDKVLALALSKHSESNYRFLSKIFALPSRKKATKVLSRISIKPGINEDIFAVLKAEARNIENSKDKVCFLAFGAMSIQPYLTVDRADGSIIGFEDYGFKTSDQIANHVQVYMLQGIRRKWKQPICYNFCSGGIKSFDVKRTLKEIIKKCNDIGLQIVATVCDQRPNNISVINSLINDTNEKYLRMGVQRAENTFEVDDIKIIPLYDVPRLFKGLRDNFMKYDICFEENGQQKLAKWEHLRTMYEMDTFFGSLRLCPKLTEQHINPRRINKTKVSLCCQVISRSVAVATNVLAHCGTTVPYEDKTLQLPSEAKDTAVLIKFLDELFDSLNGNSLRPLKGKTIRVAVTKSSQHHNFWNEAIMKLRSFKCKKEHRFVVPTSLKHLIKSIENFELLFKTLNSLGFDDVRPRTFNQDALEDYFGQIRQRGHRFVKPTADAFTPIYKSLLVDNLGSKHSFSTNCDNDDSEIYLTLRRLVTQGPSESRLHEEIQYATVPQNLPTKQTPLEKSIVKYVYEFLIERNKNNKIKTCLCTSLVLLRENMNYMEDGEFTLEIEYDRSKNSLYYVNQDFLNKISQALAITKYILNTNLHKSRVLFYILDILEKMVPLTTCQHNRLISKRIFKYLIHVTAHNFINQITNVIKGRNKKLLPANASKYFANAKRVQNNNYFIKYYKH